VDPICKSFESPLTTNFTTFQTNLKRLFRTAKRGSLKSFVRAVNATATSLNVLSGTHASLVTQIRTVQPPPADAAAVSTWLGALGQEGAFEGAAATTLFRGRIRAFFRNLKLADGALNTGIAAIRGFGFATCGVTVI